MQKSIWNHYIKDLDLMMHHQNHHILLLIDNAPTYILDDNIVLTNITIEFLPANTTTHLQPIDARIINSFKVSILQVLSANFVYL